MYRDEKTHLSIWDWMIIVAWIVFIVGVILYMIYYFWLRKKSKCNGCQRKQSTRKHSRHTQKQTQTQRHSSKISLYPRSTKLMTANVVPSKQQQKRQERQHSIRNRSSRR